MPGVHTRDVPNYTEQDSRILFGIPGALAEETIRCHGLKMAAV